MIGARPAGGGAVGGDAGVPRGALEVHALTIGGETELVHGIDLGLAPGEALGIVGGSGSGKTLTLRAIMGMLPGASGAPAGRCGPVGGSA